MLSVWERIHSFQTYSVIEFDCHCHLSFIYHFLFHRLIREKLQNSFAWAGALGKAFRGEPLDQFTIMILFLDYKIDNSFVMRIIVIGELPKTNHSCKYVSGAPKKNIVQNHLNIALLNEFQYLNGGYRHIFIPQKFFICSDFLAESLD